MKRIISLSILLLFIISGIFSPGMLLEGYALEGDVLNFVLSENENSYVAYWYNTSATEITVPDEYNGLPVTGACHWQSDEDYDRDVCDTLKKLNLGKNVIWCSVQNCIALEEITVSEENQHLSAIDGVLFSKDGTEIKKYPEGKKGESFTIPESVTEISDNAFYSVPLKEVVMSDAVTEIGSFAFAYCAYLEKIDLSDGLKNIGSNAFCNSGLKELELPQNLEKIDRAAFQECRKLEKITFNQSLKEIGSYAFESCRKIENVELGEGVEVIGDGAFNNCVSLKSFEISAGVKELGSSVFRYCEELKELTVSPENTVFSAKDNVLFNKDGTKLLLYPLGKEEKTYEVPETVTSIGAYAFLEVERLHKLVLHKDFTEVEEHAFTRSYLSELVIDENAKLSIGDYAFSDCKYLDNIRIDANVTYVGDYAFRDSNLTTVSIDSNAKHIQKTAFQNTSYSKIALAKGAHAIYISKYLISAENDYISGHYMVKNGTEAIADKAFINCKNLKAVTIPSSVINIGEKSVGYTKNTTGGFAKIEGFVIYGVKGSNAEQYAVENGFTFVETESFDLGVPVVKTEITPNGIQISWNKIENAKKYAIYRRTYNTKTKKWSGWMKYGANVTGTTLKDAGVVIGNYYSYTVRAVNYDYYGPYKATKGMKYDVTPVVTTKNVSNGIKVTWSSVANATGYTVYSSTYNAKTKKWSGWTNRGTAKAEKSAWVDKKAKPGTYYRYTVRAVYGDKKSSYKASANVIRLLNPTVKAVKSTNGIKVTWNKVAGTKNYRVYRAEYVNGKWTGWSVIKTTDNKTFALTDKTAKKGKTYKYTVRAVNGKNASSYTASKNVKR